ncbi:MAG: preprotein translocase subunit SecE [Candidatus Nomurabacteria bacterium]|jgi:preprotein translocase SecE subunit|nr:preprotein translocase subunit SecE [Candidatus Nomurabacteria bacterium]
MADKTTKIRRIKAKEAEIVKKPASKPAKNVKNRQKNTSKGKKTRKFTAPAWLKTIGRPFVVVFGPFGRYVRGSWQELRQTRWPNRRATWSMTLAVIIFCIFFAALILLFDLLFEWLVQNLNGWFHGLFNAINGNN